MSYSKPFYSTLNYASTGNIEELMKFYNPGDKTFETDFNFKTDRYSNNFQKHLFGILKLRKYQMFFKISLIYFPREKEAVKHDLVEFKVQCLKVFCCHDNKSTILLFDIIFRTTPEGSTKLYFC